MHKVQNFQTKSKRARIYGVVAQVWLTNSQVIPPDPSPTTTFDELAHARRRFLRCCVCFPRLEESLCLKLVSNGRHLHQAELILDTSSST